MRFPLAGAAASGLLIAVALGHPATGWVAAVALVPLLVVLFSRRLSPGRALLCGWVCGVIAYGLHFSYALHALHPAVFAAALAYLGLYPALFAAGVNLGGRPRLEWRCLAAPCLWTALEFIRARIDLGLPAGSLGVSQARLLPVLQIAAITGVFGLSFFLALINTTLARLWVMRRRLHHPHALTWPAVTALLTAGVLGYGFWRLSIADHSPETMHVAAVQGEIDERGLDPAAVRRLICTRYHARTLAVQRCRPDLIVYPETMTGSYLAQDSLFLAFLGDLGRKTGSGFLVGSRHLTRDGAHTRLYNSVFLVDAAGRLRGRYDKVHLVPFGEYTPFRSFLPALERFRLARSELTPGSRMTPLLHPAGVPIGAAICYEAMFGADIRRLIRNGARLLAVVSDDFWFQGTDASRQMLEEAVLRAVENRTPVVRSANMGISAIIDAWGRLIEIAPPGAEGIACGMIRLRSETSIYTRFGDLAGWGCTLAGLILIGSAFNRRMTV